MSEEFLLIAGDPDVGSKIRVERDRRGLSLTRLATLAGISSSTASRIETRTRAPSQSQLTAIRAALESCPVLTAEERAKAEAVAREQRSERMKAARKAQLLKESPERTMRGMVSEATSPILKRVLTLEAKTEELEDRSDRLEDRVDDLDDRTASLAKAQIKVKPAEPAPRAVKALSMGRIRTAAREETMDLYEDRIRLLEAALEAQAERAAKMEKEMRRRGWL